MARYHEAAPTRQRFGGLALDYWRPGADLDQPPSQRITGHLFASWRAFWETQEAETDTAGLFWSDVLDYPTQFLIHDNYPSGSGGGTLYDPETERYYRVVFVERARPRPDWNRAYLVRMGNEDGAEGGAPCAGGTSGRVIPVLFRVTASGFTNKGIDACGLVTDWHRLNGAAYIAANYGERHANEFGSFPWEVLNDYYRAPDAAWTASREPNGGIWILHRKGNLGQSGIGLNMPTSTELTRLFGLISSNETTTGHGYIVYSSPEQIADRPLTLAYESGADTAPCLATYPPTITLEPAIASSCPSPSGSSVRGVFLGTYPDNTGNLDGPLCPGFPFFEGYYLVYFPTAPNTWEAWYSNLPTTTALSSERRLLYVRLTYLGAGRWRGEPFFGGIGDSAISLGTYEADISDQDIATIATRKYLNLVSRSAFCPTPPPTLSFH